MTDKEPAKKKREMTPEMLETLARARQRAVEVRRERAEIKRKEKELRHLEEATRADEINERYAKVAVKTTRKAKPKNTPKPPPLEPEEYDIRFLVHFLLRR